LRIMTKAVSTTIVCVSLFLAICALPTTKPKIVPVNSDTKPTDKEPKSDEAKNSAAPVGKVTPASNTNTNGSAAKTAAPEVHCSRLVSAMANGGIPQECKVHTDCMGACCSTTLLAHEITYNFTVKPCSKPSVALEFKITDIEGADYKGTFPKSGKVTIPKGNMSYPGFYETESSLEVVLEKVVDITHFRLDFGLHYRILKEDPLKQLFSHTLVPMLTLEYQKELCVKPTDEDDDMYFGVIPKEYVKDRTTLALIGTSVGLAVVLLIAIIYFIVTRRRGDSFYRTYISTDENRHLTKGNDGFEPLDDSDID